jgi:hypothetical protein
MRRITLFVLALMCLGAACVRMAAAEPYQKIQILLPEGTKLQDALAVDLDLELMGRGDGDAVLLSRPSITQKLNDLGWKTTILVPDLERFYAERQKDAVDYGVWHTYVETVAEMNLLHSQYPNITTAPFSIGTTLEGRTIWAMKISDNPGVQEAEPEVLYDAMHHAREIMTVEVLLYFARYLCENYATDPTAGFLVDNRQIYFVPLVNVDGFVYNETTNPNGGGLWRKNRRNNGSCFGVDPNRNYPFQWVGSGSSTDPCSDVYRGPSAGSEAENQAMMGLINAHDFVTHDSYHSVAGMILFPWGYTLNHTPDDAIFRAIAAERIRDNGYQTGQAPEILYSVNGGFFDWAYGEQTTKPKIFSFTTEVGGSDFWPDPSERDGLIAENLYSVIYLAQIAGPTASATSLAVSGGDGNGRLDPEETADLLVTIENDGVVSSLENATVRLLCDDPYIVLTDAFSTAGTVGPSASWTNTADPFGVIVERGCPSGRRVTFTVITDADGGIHTETPFMMQVGTLPAILANDFEDAGEEWTQDATHTAVTGAFVRVDPVATPYQPGDDSTPAPGVSAWITAQNPAGLEGTDDVDTGIAASHSPDYDLSGYASVRFTVNYFCGQRDNGDDPAGDFFRIDVSPDGGASWVNLIYSGDYSVTPIWQELALNVEDYIALEHQVRFRVQASDAAPANDVIEGGIDDFLLSNAGSANQAPSAPVAFFPGNGAEVSSPVTLTVTNATDPESDPLTYGFRIYRDSDLTDIVEVSDGIVQGTGTTTWVTGPLDLGVYFWRAYAADAEGRGLFGPVTSFTVTSTTGVAALVPPAAASLLAGPNPAPGSMRIRYFVPAVSTSRLGVYDPQGRLVRRFTTAPSAAGWHETLWDGSDDSGRRVASGAYWVRLWTPDVTRTVRVVRVN